MPQTIVVAALVETDAKEGYESSRESGGLEGRRLFLARRSEKAGYGGLWELPGGKVEAGEDPKDALVREIREELGVQIAVESLAYRYEKTLGEKTFLFLVYHCRLQSWQFSLCAHDAWGCFLASELGPLPIAPLDGPALQDWAMHMSSGLVAGYVIAEAEGGPGHQA